MRKGNLLPVILVLGAIMLSGCGDNATAKTAKDTAPAVREERTEPVVTALPPEEVPQEDTREDAASPSEEAEDPSSPDYFYQPGSYDIEQLGETIFITNPHTGKIYQKDQFRLPRQDYFWIDSNTFDCIGYAFACGAEQVMFSPTSFIISFGGIKPASQEAFSSADNRPYIRIEFSKGQNLEYRNSLEVNDISYSAGTDSAYQTPPPGTESSICYLYDQEQYQPMDYPVYTYYIGALPNLIAHIVNGETGNCPLDGYSIPHWYNDAATNSPQGCNEANLYN
ncbi:hypothetical protein IJG66_01405 [Candidatus Saccharibacteria bacterium]|nr:hypothetical protein [Candidatus Saccharibacteria bacterium]